MSHAAIKGLIVLGTVAALSGPAARLVWHALGDAAVPAAALPPPSQPAPAPAADIGPALALAPFGAPPQIVDAAAPREAPLDLVLNGVAISSNPARSAAFIAHEGRSKRYGVGETITGAVTLTEVHPDHVRLDVDGETRILAFANADVQLDEPEPEAPSGLEGLLASIAPAEPIRRDDPEPPRTMQDHIDLWRDRIRSNPQDVLDRIGLIAGENGYTIADEHDSGVNMIGLRSGDVVTRVNGEAVGDVDRDRRLYDEIAASGIARIEIERGGEIITMSFPLR